VKNHGEYVCTFPSRVLTTSDGLGWTVAGVGTYVNPAVSDGFPVEIDRPLLHAVISGRYDLALRRRRTWQSEQRAPWSVLVVTPGAVDRMRWRSTSDVPLRSLHVHLDAAAAGGRSIEPDLNVRDPFISAGVWALEKAVRGGAPALYADAVAQSLVVHLAWRSAPPARRWSPALSRQQVELITDYMHARMADNITVEDLAGIIDVSKFHFIRVFAATTGHTPYQYLRRIRMRAAAELLRTTGHPSSRIAAMCGYRSAGQFAAAFRRQYGVSPTDFRA
jgi:AraC family transcriptional regulator